MFSFLKKPEPQTAYLALDIGSESVKSSIFTVEEKRGSKGNVIGKHASIFGFEKLILKKVGSGGGGMTNIHQMTERCHEVIQKTVRQARLSPSKILLGIGGEFIKGKASAQSYKRDDKEAKINLSELRNMVHKLQWSAFAKMRKQVSAETGYSEIDTKLVMADIVDIKVDGYRVSNPLGFQGREVEMSIFNAFAPSAQHNALQNIAHSFSMDVIGIIPITYALSRALVKQDEEKGGMIFIDVGGLHTDITLVSEGLLVGARTFAIGGRTFTKRLAIELNISFNEAEKLKLAYCQDRLEQKSKKIVADIIQNDVDIWLDGILLALSALKLKKALPSKILLSGGGSFLPEVKDKLNQGKWYKELSFAGKPQISFVQPKEVINVSDETGKLKGHQDFGMIALVQAALLLSDNETLAQKALRKVTGIMKV